MAEKKNWLIRTKAKRILGPITKSKVLEFYENGSFSPEDEITSGNGYWFQISEKDLLEQYLLGDLVQPFNPITECDTVLALADSSGDKTGSLKPKTAPETQPNVKKEAMPDDTLLPDEDDLAFPGSSEEASVPSGEDEDYPDLPDSPQDNVTKTVTAVANDDDFEPTKTLVKPSEESEEVVLPDEDDLGFPEMSNDHSSQKQKKN